ncbi:hypothetical protein GYMLUDRAFT_577853 [Collybiopsis luxurians FD-317 M1]|uniref:Crinkler (CRN) family protein n=1 Tax=Collybiopsis luxurians FD-317 M1 TaxID=944289 RepID=A0A0D0C0S6_9AGAR|nr:hypothetical protein GYMLUDRAFT_577853 [Collybiopsis luxurians FD-317 M1]
MASWVPKNPAVYPCTTFTRMKVKNLGQSVPSHIWTFVHNQEVLMVRQEFHDALTAINQWLIAERDGRKPINIPFTPTDALAKASTECPNPFLTDQVTAHLRLVITGLPGIGKTHFIHYIWVLRICLDLPTILCESQELLLWKNGHLYGTRLTDLSFSLLQEYVPEDTWCLFDSNNEVAEVPYVMYKYPCFILQASFPRENRLEWTRKTSVTFFLMREWSADELVAGLQIQPSGFNHSSANQLRTFCLKLGGSARDAYLNAYTLDTTLKTIKNNATLLDFSSLFYNLSVGLSNPSSHFPIIKKDFSHQYASVYPSTDDDRTQCEVRPGSDLIMEIVWEAIAQKEQMSTMDLFSRLMSERDIPDRSLGAFLYDNHYHPYLCSGRPLPCYHMTVKNPSSSYLTQSWSSLKADKEAEPEPFTFVIPDNVRIVYFFSAEDLLLEENTYYVPRAHNFPTFDSMAFCQYPGARVVCKAWIQDN